MFSILSTSLMTTSQWCLGVALVIVAIWAADEIFFGILKKFGRFGRSASNMSRLSNMPIDTDQSSPAYAENVRVAIIVPGWRETEQLSESITFLVERFGDECVIFVGSWAQDQKTHAEALRLSCQYPDVHHCEVSNRHHGLSSACINDVVAFIRGYEDDTGDQFDGYLIHEPGTTLHPAALAHVAHELKEHDILRLPITPKTETGEIDESIGFARGVEADSRAEFFYRELSMRAAFGTVSCGATAFAFSANVLRVTRDEDFLNVASLAPFYELSRRLRGHGVSTISAPVNFDVIDNNSAPKAVVGAYAADKFSFGSIVRDRSRRLLAASTSCPVFPNAKKSWAYRYGLWRDRREVFLGFQLSVALGVALFGFLVACALGAEPQISILASVPDLRMCLLLIAVVGIATRLFSRHVAVARMSDAGRMSRVIPNMLTELLLSQLAVGLTVMCWWRGLRRVSNATTERPVAELKQLRPVTLQQQSQTSESSEGRPIGELLIDWQVLSRQDRDDALAEQMRTKQQLGRILIEQGLVSERTVIEAVAHQISVETVELDVDEVPAKFGTLLSLRSMLKYRVYPFSYSSNDEIMLACYRLPQPDSVLALREELGSSIRLCLAKRTELRQLLRMYAELSRSVDMKFIAASSESIGKLVGRSRLQAAIRRRDEDVDSGRRLLGEQLVNAGYLDRKSLRLCLLQAAGKDQSLRDYLVDHGLIASTAVDPLVEKITRRAGIRLVSVNGSSVNRDRLASTGGADSEVV